VNLLVVLILDDLTDFITRICRRVFVYAYLSTRCCWRAIILRAYVYESTDPLHEVL